MTGMQRIAATGLFATWLAGALAGCSHAGLPTLPATKAAAHRSLDVRGKTIAPFVIYQARKVLAGMQDGQVLELVTDDYDALRNDIRAWARAVGQKVIETDSGPGYARTYIEKAPLRPSGKKLAMVISNPGLEELLTPLGLALTAALAGDEVHLIFQGPAVRVLEQGFTAQLSGWSWPFSRFARNGMAKAGHLPPQDKLAQIRELGAKLYVCGPSMDHFGVNRGRLAYADIVVGEYAVFLQAMAGANVAILLQ